ncbi:MAG: hypothetical protein WCT05_09820, partial [Lentisphaeria bacterium]
PEASKYLHSHSSGLAPEGALCLNAGIQAGRRHNLRQIHRLQMIPSYENSCQNRFLPSQKWELGPQTNLWIGRDATEAFMQEQTRGCSGVILLQE